MDKSVNPSESFCLPHKDNTYDTACSQRSHIFSYLQDHVSTARMASHATGVPIRSVTRAKRDFEQADLPWEVKKDLCELTGHSTWYLTTDPTKAPGHHFQGNLF